MKNTYSFSIYLKSIYKCKLYLLLIFTYGFSSLLLADGTKQVTPLNTANGAALFINPSTTTGSYFGSPNYQHIQFTIADHFSENFYFGLHPRTFNNFGTSLVTNTYYRIFDANDILVDGPTLIPTSGTGFITNYTQAVAGPNIGGATPSGYTPITFNPLADGDYYIVLYRSNTGGTTMDPTAPITFPFFDFTVSTDLNDQLPGRVWCKKWALVACDITNVNFPNPLTSSLTGHFFGYTPDQLVVDIQLKVGFRPLGFDLVLTDYGVIDNGTFTVDRKSINTNLSIPTFADGYKTFLTRPDLALFPDGNIGSINYSGHILGCSGNYFIPYAANQPGDVSILLDLDGTPGYNAGTADIVLSSFSALAGSNVVPWNGNDGLGATVANGTIAEVTITLYQGRTNIPMNDEELNTNGLEVGAVFPANGLRNMYWDDTNVSAFGTCGLSTDNVTTGGVNVSGFYDGLLSPNHAWDGSNPNTIVPALSGSQGSSTLSVFCDDFGNSRAINTWFYANDISAPTATVTIANCNVDFDNDLAQNTTDLDDDNDGILDTDESGSLSDPFIDNDLDGIPNYLDNSQAGYFDLNFDSIDDQYDTDDDAVLNLFDLDSDGDGIFDVTEVAGIDLDGNGILDGFIDANTNGLNDLVDPAAGGVALLILNTDATGKANFLDIDSDGDGIVDNIEAQATISYIAPAGLDTDADGIDDAYDLDNGGTVILITNTDGVDDPDYLDPNADNDFYSDAVEGWDTDGDDFANIVASGFDLDSDGLDDNYDENDIAQNPTNGQTPASFPNFDDAGTTEKDWREFAAVLNFPPSAGNDSTGTNEDNSVTVNCTVNDSDSDGTIDITTVDLDPSIAGLQNTFSVSGEGDYAVDNSGLVTFTPLPDFNGNCTPVNYRVKDNLGAISNFAIIQITVLPINDSPIAEPDVIFTDEDSVTTFNVSENDSDVDNDLDFSSVDLDTVAAGIQNVFATAEGNWSVDNLGNVTFAPLLNFNGIAISYYTLNDTNDVVSDTTSIAFYITALNDSPALANEVITTSEDSLVTADLTDANDLDVEGNLLASITPLSGPFHGIIFINQDGTFNYTPALNFNGTDTIVVEVCDDGFPLPIACGLDTIFLLVTPVNDAPILSNNSISVAQNGSFAGSLIDAGDFDPDSTILTADTIPLLIPSNGNIIINPDGSFVYIPTIGFAGSDTAVVQICDQGIPLPSICNNDTLFITITGTIPPVADDDSAATLEDNAIIFSVTNTDTDVDGTIDVATVDMDTLTVGIQNSILTTEGNWTADTIGNVTFSPSLNFNGTAISYYTVNDNNGATSNIAALTVTVTAVNDAPLALNDSTSTTANTPVTLIVVSNDTDVDGTIAINTVDLDPFTSGTQTTTSTIGEGDFSVNANGEVLFTPDILFVGTTTPINYTLQDDQLANSNIATITIIVGTNILPVALNDTITGVEDNLININVTFNDVDADGTIAVNTVDLDPNVVGTQTIFSIGGEGSFIVDAFGTVNFTPIPNFNGSTTPLDYTVEDNLSGTSNIATLTITITPVNDSAIAVNDSGNTFEDNTFTILLTANDTDIDGTIALNTVDLNTFVLGIQNTFTVAGQGTYNVDNAGLLSFVPFLNFNGVCTQVGYTVQDNEGGISNIAFISITVTAVNDAPVAANNVASTNEDVAVSFNIVLNDTDVDGSIDSSTVDLDPNTNGVQTVFALVGEGSFAVDNFGVVTFTPALNFNGNTTPIGYTVLDNFGLISNIATINVTVLQINDAPVAVADSAITNEDSPVTFNVTTNDTDIDGSIAANTVDLNPGLAGIQTTFTLASEGTFTVDNTGLVSFTPFLNFTGITTPINYTVQDNNGAVSNSATITITVNAANDAPIAVGNNATTNEDTPTTLNIVANDLDSDGTIQANTVDLDPLSIGLQNSFTVLAQGTYSVDLNGVVTFTPFLNFNGTCTPVNYTVQDDGAATSNIATINITVLAINDFPIASNDTATTNEDNAILINAISNDADVDGNIAANSIDLNPQSIGIQSIFVVPNQGTYTADNFGNVLFTPLLNFNGICTPVDYIVNDNLGAVSNIATINNSVTPINDAPTIHNETVSTTENTNLVIDASAGILSNGDIDIDGSALTINTIPLVTPANGSISINADGSFSYTPNFGYVGQEIVVVEICDSGIPLPAICINDTIFITVSNSLPPVTITNNYTTSEDIVLNVSASTGIISNGDLDPEGEALIVNSIPINLPDNGIVSITNDGAFVYTPNLNFVGTDLFVVSVCDPQQVCSNDSVFITVTSVNDVPVATNDFNSGNEDNQININLIANDTDIDGLLQASTIDLDSSAIGIQNNLTINGVGIFAVDGNALLTFTPSANFNGSVSVNYTVLDDLGAISNVASASLLVFAINDAPIVTNELLEINEDFQAIGDITDQQDFDVDTTLLIVNTTPTSGPFNGNILMGNDGTFTYTPTANFNGVEVIIFEICDSGNPLPSLCTFDTLTINVISINDSIFAFDDNYTINEDSTFQANLSINDTDADAVNPVYELYQPASNGNVILNPDGSFQYLPDVNLNGSDNFSYIVCDGGSPVICDTAFVAITIVPINDPIFTLASYIDLYTGTSITTDPNENNFDPDNNIDLASIAILDSTNDGSVVVNADATIVYTPTIGFIGIDTLIITICDLGDPIYCSNDTIIYNTIPGSLFGIAKSVTANQIQLDGSYNVEFTIIAENLGNEILTNIQLNESLISAFPLPTTFTIVGAPTATGSLVANSLFDGNSDQNLVVSSVSSLLVDQTDTVKFTLNIIPNGNLGPFTNSIFGNAIGFDSGVLVADVSTDGNNTDPNNDSIPNEQNPTIISFELAYSIGIAKTTNQPELQLDGTYNLTLTFDITNYGNTEANNIQATDNLVNTFVGTATYNVIFVQVLGSGLQANTNFDGNTDINLLIADQSSLQPAESEIINVILNFNPNDEAGPFYNTALATTSDDGGVILSSDSSVNGTDPDPGGNGIPEEASVTPIIFSPATNSIGLAKSLADIELMADSTYNLTFQFIVENFGSNALDNIQITDNLETAFPLPATYNIVSLTSTQWQVNPLYNGGLDTNLLDPQSNVLGVGEVDTLLLVINIDPNTDSVTFFNTAFIYSLDENGIVVTSDNSVDGNTPDPNNDGNPEESSVTIVTIDITPNANVLGISKELASSVNLGNGIIDLTYIFHLENFGNNVLNNIQVVDSIASNFDTIEYTIVSIQSSPELEANSGFDGENIVTLLTQEQSSLAIGESATITLVVQIFTLNLSGVLNNIATTTAADSLSNIVTSDLSVNGNLPDPNNDGTPTEFSPTPFSYVGTENTACMGIAKAVTNVTRANSNSYNVTYQLTVKNLCANTLNNLQVTDELGNNFLLPSSFTLLNNLSASNNLTINSNFDGVTDVNLLTSSNSSLAADQTSTIEFTINIILEDVFIPNKTYTFFNNAFATAISASGINLSDSSVNGLNPDPDGNGIPNEQSATVLTLSNGSVPPEIVLTDAFSPNGDGVNDLFVIDGLPYYYPKNNLKIFNRWGNLIFEKDNYENDWGAISNKQGVVIGSNLVPEGTYFYLLDIGLGKAIEGFIVIKY